MAEKEKLDCPCKRTRCERHGNCEACREHHAAKKKVLPACDRLLRKAPKSGGKEK